MSMENILSPKNRIVIKVGSSSIFDTNTGEIRNDRIKSIAKDISWLRKELKKDVLLMSSGALAVGKKHALEGGIPPKDDQTLGAIGQIDISNAWAGALRTQGLVMGQLLLTPEIAASSDIFKSTISKMLQKNVVPYINENIPIMDTYDNDGLSASVAKSAKCDLLILLSDVDGVYTDNPMTTPNAKKIAIIDNIDDAITKYGGGASSSVGTGGMITKLTAAKRMTDIGVETVIASGEIDNPIRAIAYGRNGTLVTF